MKKIRPLWLWLLLVLLSGVIVLLTKFRVDEVHSTGLQSSTSRSFMLFVPSPYELELINSEKDIWPRRFSSKQPPQSSDIPAIYSLAIAKRPVKREEVDFFRSLAMTAALEEWETLKDVLSYRIDLKNVSPDSLLNWVKNEKCSPYGMEIGFRPVQWDYKKLKAMRSIFENCDPESFHTLWLELLEGVESKDKARLSALREDLQKRRQFLANDSFEYFILTQAFETLDMQLAHDS